MPDRRDYPRADLLVTADWLSQRLSGPGLHVVDVRPPIPQFRIGYPWGHVPGAVHLDLLEIFSGRANGIPGMLGPPVEIAALVGNAGLSARETVVIYDGDGGPAAAQAFWLLESLGFLDLRLMEVGWGNPGKRVGGLLPDRGAIGTPLLHAPVAGLSVGAELRWLLAGVGKPSRYPQIAMIRFPSYALRCICIWRGRL